MRIHKRIKGGNWYLDATVGPVRIEKSLGTSDKKLATEYANKLIAEAFAGIKLGKKADYTFAHVMEDWLKKHTEKDRKSLDTMKQRMDWLNHYLGSTTLTSLSRTTVEACLVKNLPQKTSPSTKNRYVAEVSKLMNHAKTLEWIDNVPAYRRYTEPKGRTRWLTREEAEKLAAELPEWLRELFWFALATGLRESNVRLLRWDHVSLERNLLWIDAENAKGNRTFGIPLDKDARAILETRQGRCDLFVFGNNGDIPCRCSGPAWYAALKKLDMVGFRWHELRHTWASWHAMRGTPMSVLQQLGGWATPSMTARYSHLSESYLAQWVKS